MPFVNPDNLINKKIIITKMTDKDISEVIAIERLSFVDPWAEISFHNELNNNFSNCFVLKNSANRVIGYTIFWSVVDEIHILNIAVHPDERNKGYGKQCVSIIIEKAKSDSVRYITLEVRPSNLMAIALYKKFGFQSVGLRPRYYKNNEDAIIMCLEIK